MATFAKVSKKKTQRLAEASVLPGGLPKLDMKEWYQATTQKLIEKASGGNSKNKNSKKAQLEAKERSSLLSTSSDKKGVKFSGGAFQADYFSSKFQRRGTLLYSILSDLNYNFNNNNGKAKTKQEQVLRVASFGGGPGTDIAGITWGQRTIYKDTRFVCTLYDYEKTWKRYISTLAKSFEEVSGSKVSIKFQPCDVTKGLGDNSNRKIERVEDVDICLFFYVCHETSNAAKKGKLMFYRDLCSRLKPGCVVILADVKGKSKKDLQLVYSTLKGSRKVNDLKLRKKPNAEVVVFSYEL
jgi:hypothetical protein